MGRVGVGRRAMGVVRCMRGRRGMIVMEGRGTTVRRRRMGVWQGRR